MMLVLWHVHRRGIGVGRAVGGAVGDFAVRHFDRYLHSSPDHDGRAVVR